MSYEPLLSVHRVLPDGGAGTFSSAEVRSLLEVAFLATCADDVLAEEEIVAFRELAEALARLGAEPRAVPHDTAGLVALQDEFAEALDDEGRPARLAALAKTLTRGVAREAAYKVALAVGMCDFSSSSAEGDFEEELLEALGFDADAADRLAAEVYDAIGGDEEEEEDEGDDDEDDDDLDDEETEEQEETR
jgi:hypothetical protein